MSRKNQSTDGLTFANLVTRIGDISSRFSAQAKIAVNLSLTVRNWLIGYYIYQYEQKGSDRAGYAQQLLGKLAQKLEKLGISRTQERELRRYRQFYLYYPQIRETLSPELKLVEYALASMNNGLFVSKYQLELTQKEEMQKFIEEKMRENS